jgi:hypothetical protein
MVSVRLPSRTLFLPQLKEAFYKFAISKRRDLGWTDRNHIRAYHKSHNMEYPYCMVSYKYDEDSEFNQMENLDRWCEEYAPDIMSNTTLEPIVGPVFILEYSKANSATHCFTFKDIDMMALNLPKVAAPKIADKAPEPKMQKIEDDIVDDELITFYGTSLKELAALVTGEPWTCVAGSYAHLNRYMRALFIAASQNLINVSIHQQGNLLALNTNLRSNDQYIYAICFKKINQWIVYKFVTTSDAKGFDCRNEETPIHVLKQINQTIPVMFELSGVIDQMKKEQVFPDRWQHFKQFKKEEVNWFFRGMAMTIKDRIAEAVPALYPIDDYVTLKFYVPVIDDLVAEIGLSSNSYICSKILSQEQVIGYCRVMGPLPKWMKK